MLSGEGNENGQKTTTGLISNLARAAHFFCTFLCCCFARLQRKTPRNFLVTRFMEEMSQVFVLPFFSQPLTFNVVTAGISHFSPLLQNFHVVFPTSFLFSLSLSSSLSPFFSLSFAGLLPTFSFSLPFSFPIFHICGPDNQSKLNTLDNTDTETISAFCFRLY